MLLLDDKPLFITWLDHWWSQGWNRHLWDKDGWSASDLACFGTVCAHMHSLHPDQSSLWPQNTTDILPYKQFYYSMDWYWIL